jgi:hypothetical protein
VDVAVACFAIVREKSKTLRLMSCTKNKFEFPISNTFVVI